MPAGVALEDSWQEVLENRLNADSGGRHFEVINFSVGGYDPRQRFATLKYRAATYAPDLILVEMTTNSPWMIRRDDVYHRPFVPRPTDHPARHSFVLERLLPRDRGAPSELLPRDQAPAAFRHVLGEFRTFAAASGKPLCFVILQHNAGLAEATKALRDQVAQGDTCVIDTSAAFRTERFADLTILRTDDHPNARAQQIFARTVFDDLVARHLLEPGE